MKCEGSNSCCGSGGGVGVVKWKMGRCPLGVLRF